VPVCVTLAEPPPPCSDSAVPLLAGDVALPTWIVVVVVCELPPTVALVSVVPPVVAATVLDAPVAVETELAVDAGPLVPLVACTVAVVVVVDVAVALAVDAVIPLVVVTAAVVAVVVAFAPQPRSAHSLPHTQR
jgi:hypothetical protein